MNHGVVERLTRAAKDLQSLPSLAKAEDLKCLRARSNALRDLPELSPRARLLELTAAFNQIERLDLTAPAFHALTYLNLDGNLLEAVDGLDSMVDLTHLYLANNSLQQLPHLAATQLFDLDLSHNRLQRLPYLGSFDKLQLLNAENNCLTSVPGLGNLTRLKWLRLTNNNLTELPSLKACIHMRLVSVSHNSLVSIGRLPVFLDELIAGHNRLTRLSIPKHIRMHSLSIPHNLLEEFSLRRFAKSLLYLSVRGNRLKRLPGLENLDELRFLDASENQLTEFPAAQRLHDLQGLCLTNNNLLELPDLSGFRFLQSLGCAGNPLSERPQAPKEIVCDCCANASMPDTPLHLAWCVGKNRDSLEIRRGVIKEGFALFSALESRSQLKAFCWFPLYCGRFKLQLPSCENSWALAVPCDCVFKGPST